MSDCDDDFGDFDDDFGYDDFDGYDSALEEGFEFPREVDLNFVCVDVGSLVPEKLLKCRYNEHSILCFLVRWKGFDRTRRLGTRCGVPSSSCR